jgi:bla regulator protein BlaR1
MSAFIDQLNQVSLAWAALMGAILWQSTLLVLVVTIVAALLRGASPRVRYWLWQIVTIKLLVMPFWVLAVPIPLAVWQSPPAGEQTLPMPHVAPHVMELPNRPFAAAEKQPPAVPTPAPRAPSVFALINWASWLLVAWAVVILWRVAWIVRQRYGLGRLMRLTTPAHEDLVSLVRGLAQKLGLKREPNVLLVDNPGLLFVCGLWGPNLVLPRTLPTTLRPEEMEQVILHELAHLRRGDLYWG